MNWTVFVSALVGAMLGAGFVLVFVPRKVRYEGLPTERFNEIVRAYNKLESEFDELWEHVSNHRQDFDNHTHPEYIKPNPRREVTGYIQSYDDEPDPPNRRASRNPTSGNLNTRIRRGSAGRGGY